MEPSGRIDEVYGTLGPNDPAFHEKSPFAPNSPNAASAKVSDFTRVPSRSGTTIYEEAAKRMTTSTPSRQRFSFAYPLYLRPPTGNRQTVRCGHDDFVSLSYPLAVLRA
jgi:hypothetical protein